MARSAAPRASPLLRPLAVAPTGACTTQLHLLCCTRAGVHAACAQAYTLHARRHTRHAPACVGAPQSLNVCWHWKHHVAAPAAACAQAYTLAMRLLASEFLSACGHWRQRQGLLGVALDGGRSRCTAPLACWLRTAAPHPSGACLMRPHTAQPTHLALPPSASCMASTAARGCTATHRAVLLHARRRARQALVHGGAFWSSRPRPHCAPAPAAAHARAAAAAAAAGH